MSSAESSHHSPPSASGPIPVNNLEQVRNSNNPPSEQQIPQYESPTSEPFPSLDSKPPFQYNASLHPIDTRAAQAHPTIASPHGPTPVSAGLRLQTEHLGEQNRPEYLKQTSKSETPQQTNFNAGLPVRNSSIRSAHSSRTHRADSLSPASIVSSPNVGPLADMSPLPSPISMWGSPRLWRSPVSSEENAASDKEQAVAGADPPLGYIPFARTSPKKRRFPVTAREPSSHEASTQIASATSHAKSRSLSEYVPEGMQVPRPRNIIVSTSGAPHSSKPFSPLDDSMHRESYLAVQRGLATPKLPTPPDSNQSTDSHDLDSPEILPQEETSPIYEARTIRGGEKRRWRAISQLGQGTFSTVMLATSEGTDVCSRQYDAKGESFHDPKSLVAVKVCEQGPAEGPDEKKVETSIQRELDLMKATNHTSLIHLKAVGFPDRQALLVLNYSPGGDLFELATSKLDLLTPSLIRRMFSELVAATQYLHDQYIVHRDIKLENIFVNLPRNVLSTVSDWQAYPSPVITLGDLGLGRWIPRPPESPLLERRCGSEDYAAPEVLLSQPYDGRATDAWQLGVTLYSLMEGRLPFDPLPGSRRKSPTGHQIARCEWQWVKYADNDGEWDAVKGKALEGAREVVECLIARKRDRWNLEKVQGTEWVSGGIQVVGGIRREEDDNEL